MQRCVFNRIPQKLALTFFCFYCLCFTVEAQGRTALDVLIQELDIQARENPKLVIKRTDSLLVSFDTTNRTPYAKLLNIRGIALCFSGKPDDALQHIFHAYDIFEKINNKSGMAMSLCNAATVHYSNFHSLNVPNYKAFDKAREYLNRAERLTPVSDSMLMHIVYLRKGLVADMSGEYDVALSMYSKALSFLNPEKDRYQMAMTLHNVAVVYGVKMDFKNCEKYELLALEKLGDTKSDYIRTMICISLGSLYLELKRLDDAERYLLLAGKTVNNGVAVQNLVPYYTALTSLYKAKNDYPQAMIYMHRLMNVQDSLNNIEMMRSTAEMEELFQNSLKTKEIELLTVQNELADQKVQKSRFLYILFGLIALLTSVILFVLYRNYKLKQIANIGLQKERQLLLQENKQLVNENVMVQFETLRNQVSPHFLFNSLNALSSLIKTDPDQAVKFTQAFSKIFRSVLQIKDKPVISLLEEMDHVRSYLHLQKMRFGDSLQITENIDEECLDLLLPPLALQLVVENAIKHNAIGANNPLEIKITAHGNFVEVSNCIQRRNYVEDSTGTGIKNVLSRYRYLTDEVPVFENRGTEFYVKLPLIEA